MSATTTLSVIVPVHNEQTWSRPAVDTVVCLNVVEHPEDDVHALRNVRSALEEGGRAIVLVPNDPRLFGSLDRALGHHRRYTRQRLMTLGEQAGFSLEALLAFNRIRVLAWWLNGRILQRGTFGLWQIKMLNLLTPLFRRLDPWLSLPPLSLIAIFQPKRSEEMSAVETRAPAPAQVYASQP